MTLRELPDVIRSAPPLMADDSVAKAIRLLRARGLPALPVAQEGRLAGMVYEDDLLALAAGAPDPGTLASQVRVGQVARPVALVVSEHQDIASIARALQETHLSFVPVTAADGRYLGIALRRDLLAALVGEPPPPPIAGLATPFGVHLTTGALRAGASNLSLASTGAALMIINLISYSIIFGLAKFAGAWLASAPSPRVAAPGSAGMAAVLTAYVMQMAVFLLLLRLSPLTGIHAAEHMVVHAIEEGEDLTPEKVRAMPRVHPRCGTNLMALLILLLISEQFFSSMNSAVDEATRALALVALVTIILLTWRRVGAGLQRWVTTRPPTDRQLEGAIKTGEALLAQVRSQPAVRSTTMRRVWNAGFVQVAAGFMVVAALAEYGWPVLAALWSRWIG